MTWLSLITSAKTLLLNAVILSSRRTWIWWHNTGKASPRHKPLLSFRPVPSATPESRGCFTGLERSWLRAHRVCGEPRLNQSLPSDLPCALPLCPQALLKMDCQGLVVRLIQDFVLLTTAVEVAQRWRELAEKLAKVSKQQMDAYESPHRDRNGVVDSEVSGGREAVRAPPPTPHVCPQGGRSSQEEACARHMAGSR